MQRVTHSFTRRTKFLIGVEVSDRHNSRESRVRQSGADSEEKRVRRSVLFCLPTHSLSGWNVEQVAASDATRMVGWNASPSPDMSLARSPARKGRPVPMKSCSSNVWPLDLEGHVQHRDRGQHHEHFSRSRSGTWP